MSFYFGARHQTKGQEFQRSIAASLAQAPNVAENITKLRAIAPRLDASTEGDVVTTVDVLIPAGNAALDDWKAKRSE